MLLKYFLLVLVIYCGVAADAVILFHGMGDQCSNSGMKKFTQIIGTQLNISSVCVEVGNGASTSLFLNFSKQVEEACDKISQDPRLQGNVSVIGLSQGALIARAVIQNCPTYRGTVNRYLSIGGPHMGVARIPGCFHGHICNAISWIVNKLVYQRFLQKNFGPAGYFHNYKSQHHYLKKSAFLPSLNYDLNKSEQGYKKLLNTHTMLVMFDQDSMIYPKQSSWFQFFDAKGELMSFFETPHYTKDLLPLRQMFLQKRLTFIRIEGDHLKFSDADVKNTFIPFLKGVQVLGEIPTDKIMTEDDMHEEMY